MESILQRIPSRKELAAAHRYSTGLYKMKTMANLTTYSRALLGKIPLPPLLPHSCSCPAMEGLVLESIPHQLLARIILQLYVVPVSAIQHKQINLMTILVAGLHQFGQSSNLDGLFQYCLQATKEHFASREGDQFRLDKWSWKRRDLATPEDWELLSATTPDDHEPVALHIQITAEEVNKRWWIYLSWSLNELFLALSGTKLPRTRQVRS